MVIFLYLENIVMCGGDHMLWVSFFWIEAKASPYWQKWDDNGGPICMI
jgi:hypothetical protein